VFGPDHPVRRPHPEALDLEIAMRRSLIIATTAAGAALAAGLIAVPALAGSTTTTTTSPTTSTGYGTGYGVGTGAGMGVGNGTGLGRSAQGTDADPLAGLSQGTLTADQKSRLAGMAEEEKLAHDVYVVLAASTQDARFARIATAEARHLTEVRALLARYGIADPTAGKADGQFATGSVQELFGG
jgi:hypothetical protein